MYRNEQIATFDMRHKRDSIYRDKQKRITRREQPKENKQERITKTG